MKIYPFAILYYDQERRKIDLSLQSQGMFWRKCNKISNRSICSFNLTLWVFTKCYLHDILCDLCLYFSLLLATIFNSIRKLNLELGVTNRNNLLHIYTRSWRGRQTTTNIFYTFTTIIPFITNFCLYSLSVTNDHECSVKEIKNSRSTFRNNLN